MEILDQFREQAGCVRVRLVGFVAQLSDVLAVVVFLARMEPLFLVRHRISSHCYRQQC